MLVYNLIKEMESGSVFVYTNTLALFLSRYPSKSIDKTMLNTACKARLQISQSGRLILIS